MDESDPQTDESGALITIFRQQNLPGFPNGGQSAAKGSIRKKNIKLFGSWGKRGVALPELLDNRRLKIGLIHRYSNFATPPPHWVLM